MKKKKILIVDDEFEIRELIARYLSVEGFLVTKAESGREGLELFEKHEFDLIVLDIMLGDTDGFEILKQVRRNSFDIPVLFLSARREEYDKVIGLGLGADDYVTKPFSPAELTARIKAHLRRSSKKGDGQESRKIVKGPFTLDMVSYNFYKGQQLIELSAKEIKLIQFFLGNPNQVFTKRQIYKNVWENDIYDDNSVMVYINHLREKIEDNPKEPAFIQTVWGIGYKFCVVE